jgi:hypothetical protein
MEEKKEFLMKKSLLVGFLSGVLVGMTSTDSLRFSGYGESLILFLWLGVGIVCLLWAVYPWFVTASKIRKSGEFLKYGFIGGIASLITFIGVFLFLVFTNSLKHWSLGLISIGVLSLLGASVGAIAYLVSGDKAILSINMHFFLAFIALLTIIPAAVGSNYALSGLVEKDVNNGLFDFEDRTKIDILTVIEDEEDGSSVLIIRNRAQSKIDVTEELELRFYNPSSPSEKFDYTQIEERLDVEIDDKDFTCFDPRNKVSAENNVLLPGQEFRCDTNVEFPPPTESIGFLVETTGENPTSWKHLCDPSRNIVQSC